MEEWAEEYNPSNYLDSMEEETVTSLPHATNTTISTNSISINPPKLLILQ